MLLNQRKLFVIDSQSEQSSSTTDNLDKKKIRVEIDSPFFENLYDGMRPRPRKEVDPIPAQADSLKQD